MSSKFCPQCGAAVSAGQRFCPTCGRPLAGSAPPAADPDRVTPPPAAGLPPSGYGAGPSAPPPAPGYNPATPNYSPGPTGPAAPPPPYQAVAPAYPVAYPAPAPRGGGAGRVVLIVLAVLIVMIAACAIGTYLFISRTVTGVTHGLSTAISSDGISTAVAQLGDGTPFAVTTAAPINRPLTTAPRAFTYAGLQFAVVSGVISNSTAFDPAITSDAATHLDLHLAITNPSAQSINVSAALLQVRLGDGRVLKQPVDVGLQAQDTQAQTVSFAVPVTTTWTAAQLTFSQVGDDPAVLPLEGALPAAAYPVALPTGGHADLTNPALTYTVISATLDLDSFGKRTPSGKRYLNLTVRAACHATHSCYVGPESFRLLVGGQAQAAETLDPAAAAVASDTQQDLRLAFLVPATDTSMVLQVGEATLGTAQVPLDLSGAP